ncbi:MAG: helix-turn-helix domain-containing protein [Phycisphaerales bacterium]|nr:helix-turn-helix domain-containing protein [Phycisphaerales bacterium]
MDNLPLILSMSDLSGPPLGIAGERTLWRWVSTGQFPPPDIVVGRKYRRWKRETIESWIAEQSGKGGRK